MISYPGTSLARGHCLTRGRYPAMRVWLPGGDISENWLGMFPLPGDGQLPGGAKLPGHDKSSANERLPGDDQLPGGGQIPGDEPRQGSMVTRGCFLPR